MGRVTGAYQTFISKCWQSSTARYLSLKNLTSPRKHLPLQDEPFLSLKNVPPDPSTLQIPRRFQTRRSQNFELRKTTTNPKTKPQNLVPPRHHHPSFLKRPLTQKNSPAPKCALRNFKPTIINFFWKNSGRLKCQKSFNNQFA